ncbi:MAG: hypothetical protein AB3N33_11115 [Puniceicoccaceae bacterium]
MTCSLSWYRRDETGKRQQIEFKLVREKAHWIIHRERFEPRETYEPDEEDWDTLLEQMDRNLKRGKVYPKDLEIVRRLKEKSLS